ncbi:MAG TPA: protamine-2 (modular protein) [Mesorhizobium sp.]|jgi:hypothetical protein|uniref:protamine-2 (modular protein) n=1 Tax=Mesorhizobium sp. TaxID=1871066 RepID=UPI002DDD7B1A|nr:protamine-2 (modular protein) [Mesorhizobium sp.]HEV2505398.1 protamine-2 (modular protein) [Mesorhizobium sp.]
MERRQFLMSALGLAGAAVAVSAMRPAQAFAGVAAPGPGILDELDKAEPAVLDGGAEAQVEQVDHRSWHRRGWDGRRGWDDRPGWRRHHWRDGPRGGPRWRRVCRRVWRRGEWRVRCWRERAWRGGW